MKSLLKLLWWELKGQKQRSLLLFVFLLTSFIAPRIVLELRILVNDKLTGQGRDLLTADVVIRGRFPLEEQQLAKIQSDFTGSKMQQEISLFSMVKDEAGIIKLSQLRGVESTTPFYGVKKAEDPIVVAGKMVAVSYQSSLFFSAQKGKKLTIGGQDFTVSSIITQDSSKGAFNLRMAPEIFLTLDELKKSSLFGSESLVTYKYLFKTPMNDDQVEDLKAYLKTLTQQFNVQVASESAGRSNRGINYFLDFLSLVGIIVQLLGLLALFYFLSRDFYFKVKNLSLIEMMGGSRGYQFLYLFLPLALMCLFSQLVIELVVVPLTPKLLTSFMPGNAVMEFPPLSYFPNASLWYMGLTLFFLFFFSLYFLLTFQKAKLSETLLGEVHLKIKNTKLQIFFFTMLGMVLYLQGWWMTRSLLLSSILIGALLLSALGSQAILMMALFLTRKLKMSRHLPLFYSVKRFRAYRSQYSLSLLIMSFVLILFGAITQLESSLMSELSLKEQRPSLFLFDIQKEQLDSVIKLVKTEDAEIHKIAPLVRGRFDQQFDDVETKSLIPTREEETNQRFKKRFLNLSYEYESTEQLYQLSDDTEILEGQEKLNDYTEDPLEVALEKNYAKRLGVGLGDELKFDIHGMPVVAKVVQIRRIRWLSFLPNFFINFAKGFLELAPQSYLLALSGQASEEWEAMLSKKVVTDYPNVSLIPVNYVLQELAKVIKLMFGLLKVIAILSLLVSLLFFWSLMRGHFQERQGEFRLLEQLGLTDFALRKMWSLEWFNLTVLSLILFTPLVTVVSWFFAQEILQGVWLFDYGLFFLQLFLSLVVMLILSNFIFKSIVTK